MPEPTTEQLRDRAAEIVARPEYDLSTRRVELNWLNDLILEILRWIIAPFRWVYELTEGLPEVFRWLIVAAMVVALLALVWHMIYTLAKAMRGESRAVVAEAARRELDPAKWERRAAEASAGGDYITAVRHLFRAALLRIELAEKKPHRPGTTNRELLARYRKRPEVVEPLKHFVETIDRKWYGDELCTETDYAQCVAAHDGLRRAMLRGSDYALGA